MQRTERHIIRQNNENYSVVSVLSFLAKNLYNSALYDVRQHYFEHKEYKHHNQVITDFTRVNQPDYIALPRKVSQQVIRLVGQNFRSFFGLLKAKQNGSLKTQIKLPKYLEKNGRYVLAFPKDALSKKVVEINDGLFEHTLCGRELGLKIKSRVPNPDMVRIVPKNDYFVIEIVYTVNDVDAVPDNGRYASVDLGVKNLMTVFFNTGEEPLLFGGGPVKSVNQFYNKKKAVLQSKLGGGKRTSKRIRKLAFKRNMKIDWLLHNASRQLVNHLVSSNISCLVIGLNKNWKQDINLGKRNNQSFVSVPFSKLIHQLKYKCEEVGIKVVLTEESYTSKCSAIDKESINKHVVYAGKRVKRGLFKSSSGFLFNADVNGAINIMRKVVPDNKTLFEGIEDAVGHPVIVKYYKHAELV